MIPEHGISLQGLVVPVIRNVETMNFTDIEKAINALGEKVKRLCARLFYYLQILICKLVFFHTDVMLKKKWISCQAAVSCCFPQARKNELAVEDMDGGTFTISNGGVFGSLFGTPIINPPQSAILGMHGIFDRPVAISGKVRLILSTGIGNKTGNSYWSQALFEQKTHSLKSYFLRFFTGSDM